jgi:hypothetical protein
MRDYTLKMTSLGQQGDFQTPQVTPNFFPHTVNHTVRSILAQNAFYMTFFLIQGISQ